MSGDWSFKAFDLRTASYLRDIDITDWASIDTLTDAGSWTATVQLPEDPADVTSIRGSTSAGRTVIVAFRNGLPIFSGIVWRRAYDSATRSVGLAGRGLLSYFDHFIIPTRLTYGNPSASVDQLTIFQSVVADLFLRYDGSAIGLTVHGETSGVLRDRTYEVFDVKPYGEALLQLSAVDNGFDADIRSEIVGGVLERHLRLWYPRRGRTIAASGLQFRTGSNAVLFATTEDATALLASITLLGSGDGPSMLTAQASSPDLVAAGWPPFSGSLAMKDITIPATLQAHATREITKRSQTDADAFGVQIDPEFSDQPWGAWDLGDDVSLVVEDDPWYPAQTDGSPGLVVERRITSHEWKFGPQGESLKAVLTRKVV